MIAHSHIFIIRLRYLPAPGWERRNRSHGPRSPGFRVLGLGLRVAVGRAADRPTDRPTEGRECGPTDRPTEGRGEGGLRWLGVTGGAPRHDVGFDIHLSLSATAESCRWVFARLVARSDVIVKGPGDPGEPTQR